MRIINPLSQFLVCWLPLAIWPFLTGCGTIARVATERAIREKQNANDAATASTYVASLAPIDAKKVGPGLLIFEPRGPKNRHEFGAGCTRWLQLQAGGQGELGRTPSLRVYEMARQPLNLTDWRLDFAKAREVARYGGATHFATSQIAPNSLEISLYELASQAQKPLARFGIEGADAQILAKLPDLAKQIAQKMGVSQPEISSQVRANAAQMAFLGAQPIWLEYGETLAPQTKQALQKIGEVEPLGASLTARLTKFPDEGSRAGFCAKILKIAPKNPLIWAEVWMIEPTLARTHAKTFDEMKRRFPHHLALTTAHSLVVRGDGETQQAIDLSEKLVQISPQNVHAWWMLGESLSDTAQAKRNSRYASDIGIGEWGTLGDLYARGKAAMQHATKLAPRDAEMWASLAVAATFDGDDFLAQNALEMALKLDPKCGRALYWGMQMTQPKWGGSVDEFKDFSAQAAAHSDVFHFKADDLVRVLYGANRWKEAKPILETAMKANPKNADVLCELGQILHYSDQTHKAAEKLYHQALALDPDHLRALNSLADIEFFVNSNPKKALALRKKVLKIDPKDTKALEFVKSQTGQ